MTSQTVVAMLHPACLANCLPDEGRNYRHDKDGNSDKRIGTAANELHNRNLDPKGAFVSSNIRLFLSFTQIGNLMVFPLLERLPKQTGKGTRQGGGEIRRTDGLI
jgi:hypothetical protein